MKRKNNNHKDHSFSPKKKKTKPLSNNKTLIRCIFCNGHYKSISHHLYRSKKCHKHYISSNTIYLPDTNTESTDISLNHQTNSTSSNTQIQPNLVPSSINSIFGKSTIIRQMSSIPDQESQILCNNAKYSTNITSDIDNTLNVNSIEYCTETNDNDNDDCINFTNSLNENNTTSSNVLNLCSISNEIYMKHKSSQFEPTTLLSIKLFKILTKSNSPVYLFDEITDFIKHSFPIMKSSNKRSIKSRKKLLEIIYSTVLNGSQLSKQANQSKLKYMFDLYPKNIKFQVTEIPIQIIITKFDMKSAIVSLLIDPIVMNTNNLLMNESTYLNPMNSNHEYYGDIHTGYWFKNAHSSLCKEKDDLLCPLIFFIDGVSLDSFGRQSLEPVTFTLGIFKRKARNSNMFWRILGYIPNLEKVYNINYTNSQKNNNLKKIHYQEILSCILKELKHLQDSGGFRWKFPNGKEYNLKFPIMYIIGDAQGLDKICNRKIHYTPTKTFMTGCCRDCNSVYKHCHLPDFTCKFHKTSIIQRLSSHVLKSISYIPVKINAFADLCFGNDKHGLVGACPPEPLHQWYLGVIEIILNYFWERLTITARNYLDNVICGISKECGRQSDRDMPNIKCFQKGLMKEKLTGMERGQQLFMLYLALLPSRVKQEIIKLEQKSGNRYSQDNRKDKTKTIHPKVLNSFPKYNQWLSILESMLSISEWLRLEQVPKIDVENNIEVCLKHDTNIFDCDEITNTESINQFNHEDMQSSQEQQLCTYDDNDSDSSKEDFMSTHNNSPNNTSIQQNYYKDNSINTHFNEDELNSGQLNQDFTNTISESHGLTNNNSSAISSRHISSKNVLISKSEKGLRNFMKDILDVFPSKDEKKLQVLKFHQTIHYPKYIKMIGSVENFNGGPSEENMKAHVTNPGRRTQRRNTTLAFQSSIRYTEKLIIDIGHNIAMKSGQYQTSLFKHISNEEYFMDVGIDNFQVCNLDVNDSHNTNTNSLDKSYSESNNTNNGKSRHKTMKNKKKNKKKKGKNYKYQQIPNKHPMSQYYQVLLL